MYRVSPERDGTISMEMQTPNRTQNSKLCQTHLHLQIHIHKKIYKLVINQVKNVHNRTIRDEIKVWRCEHQT